MRDKENIGDVTKDESGKLNLGKGKESRVGVICTFSQLSNIVLVVV